ncbi:MAG: xanthine dehydrogenase family protein [Proteobacteria bacterium]|nr:xanthine dehydrogenase family protein [Pseudomonadota bacterium]
MERLGRERSGGRIEDGRFLTGRGRFTDDIRPPGLLCAHVLRSPHAHALILAIDTAAAAAMPGVAAILTAADAADDGLGTIPCVSNPRTADGRIQSVVAPPHTVLAQGRARMVGDPVALVVAATPAQARDAAEAVAVAYEAMPAVTDAETAAAPGAPQLWAEAPGNLSFRYAIGDRGAVEAALARAHHVTRLRMAINRVSANPLEPRAAIGDYDRSGERYVLHAPVQTPHQIRQVLAGRIFRVSEHRVRVVVPDVGGGFGMKGGLFREYILVLWAARRLGRPVKWTCERSEAFLSDDHARDNIAEAALALDEEGRFLGLEVRSVANLGAYLSFRGAHSPTNNLGSLSGVYTTPAVHAEVRGVFTNTQPTSPYRGAGRPEASYVIERLIDVAAAETGIDRLEIRRRNCIPPEAMPYRTGLLFTYDSGDFAANMALAAEAADWAGFEARRAAARRRGRLRGIGLANCIEQAGGPFGAPWEERAELRFDPGGGLTVLVGTLSSGQGHETVFTRLVGARLGIDPALIRVVQGDTDLVPFGRGTFGSRTVMTGGSTILNACDKVIEKGRRIAAHLLEAGEGDIAFADGRFAVAGTDRTMALAEVVRAAFSVHRLPPGLESGLDQAATWAPGAPTYPNGCHVCELEVDPETGRVEVLRYLVVDDVGRVLDHALLDGQVHGGVAQGLGQILHENIAYDAESGQLLTGSFTDYSMPRADDLPLIEVRSNEVPTDNNPLGVKGAGEAGTIGALPAVMSAVVDALSPLGIRHLDMPATPERVWRVVREARRRARAGGPDHPAAVGVGGE